jgi:sugar transferase (PEP-CTERM system associated)
MIRVFNVYFPARAVFLGASELVVVFLAFTAAVVARAGRDADLALADEHGLYKIALVAGVYLLCMYYLDLYDTKNLSNRHEILTRTLQVLGSGTIILGVIYYAYPDARLGRGTFLLGLLFALPFLVVWREAFLWLIASLHVVDKVVIIGQGSLALALCREFRTRPELGFDLVGFIDVSEEESALAGAPCIGRLEELPQLISRHRVTQVIIAMAERRGKLPLAELLSLKSKGMVVQDGADLYESLTGKIQLESLRPGWLLFSPGFRASRGLLLYKRAVSFVLSLATLILSLPLFILAAIAIRLDSKGPIIFRQQRVGKNGKLFYLHKFRTMVDGADAGGRSRPAEDDDARCTRVGQWLRRTRLDELPQLYNILRGDMDYVGPRPFVPDQEEECGRKIPFYEQRWTIKPGATGWAQINYGYCASLEDNLQKTAYDLYYLKHMSIGLDLFIIFQTVKVLLLGRGGR